MSHGQVVRFFVVETAEFRSKSSRLPDPNTNKEVDVENRLEELHLWKMWNSHISKSPVGNRMPRTAGSNLSTPDNQSELINLNAVIHGTSSIPFNVHSIRHANESYAPSEDEREHRLLRENG
jgi:hypothetical protein